ncbi:MAG: SPFH domain-containing protein [Metallibacterium scheffleri]|jgi:regulator of protease activity HflC (stomatin/prohibitin superfamily)|uniref:SPFH domain-containing protein n=1 Tax=Metallibacterium scheffleri TaxID=993689 RepID=UPI0026EB2724|nr:SPFH domain-containing protein [Metallibacterium scheffleri]MCK9367013.1 SPFH domain-containing protein [Metallibacterium scheffleri]
MNERKGFSLLGIATLIALLIIGLLLLWWIVAALVAADPAAALAPIVLGALWLFLLGGFFQVQPNEARVLQLFGRYAGSVRDAGLRWTNPLYSKRTLSLRVRNFDSDKLKVNDADGNPIEIAAVVVWQVVESYEAVFEVQDYESFLKIQTESALRQMSQNYAYDSHDERPSLRSHGEEVNAHLRDQIQERLNKAGLKVIEARISHLAYAPEIAQVMLQRQQANAIVAARERIVEGAVGMAQMALKRLEADGVVELDPERKAAIVANLLVVLCGDRATQPVVNTGTLYNG